MTLGIFGVLLPIAMLICSLMAIALIALLIDLALLIRKDRRERRERKECIPLWVLECRRS